MAQGLRLIQTIPTLIISIRSLIILYTASDTSSTALTDRYGAFTDDLGTTNEETYSAEIPFSQRAGISTLIPYAGSTYLLATEEVLPPRLT